MKSLRLTIIALFAFVTMANAQFYVGGSFGINSNTNSSKSGSVKVKGPSSFSFGLAPELGIFLSEDLAVGGRIGFQIATNKTRGEGGERGTKSINFGITPYANYYLLHVGKLSIFAEANLPIGFGSSSLSALGTTTDGPSTFNFGINLLPGLAYKVNDNILLRTRINFLNVGFNLHRESTTFSNPLDNSTRKSSKIDTSFKFGANMDNIATLGAISIGAIFIF